MFQAGHRAFPNYSSNPPTEPKGKNNDNNSNYYLTLTLLAFLFIGTLTILIAVILELMDQEQKAIRLQVKRKLSPSRRYNRKKSRKHSNKIDRLLAQSQEQLDAVKEEFNLYQTTELDEQLRSTSLKTALLLLVIVGGFIRVIAYATEIILVLQGGGALVGSMEETGGSFTIP